ncbi:hypothetical protein [Paraburkholderia bryophila]|uniref:Uncharacterized protein n=1 Tax=Paraburkholderia bryophila TaxID=420952 RepID=A0A7Y9WNQ8_9BURK|nr:hypothetical protein [Paraburkholderia bryophila]NYH24236.1 hypothetical protein [Paraburkholderia bryophila]
MATYVVDQNRMRKPELQTLITQEPDARFVIPDVAFVEMSKNETHWKDTMRSSLVPLRPAVQRTVLSLSVGEAMSIELASGRAIDAEALLPEKFAHFVQELVVELDEARTGNALSTLGARFANARAALGAHELDAEGRKATIEGIEKSLRRDLKPEVLKALRSNQFDPDFRLAFIQSYVQQLLFPEEMEKAGMSETDATAFKAEQPMVLRYWYLLTRHAVDWMTSGGLSGIKATKELNHLLDMDYAAIASYFDGLLSEDEAAMAAYNDLRQMLDTSEEDAVAAYKSVFDQVFPDHTT